MARTKQSTPEPCVWQDMGECYETDCGQAFTLEWGTPTANKMRFCCYCGAPLKVKA
jgi:hypothetical protein